MQSKKHSHYEIIANQISGLAIGWFIVFFIFPFMGMESTVVTATASSAIFFTASYARSYTIRRIFNKKAEAFSYYDEPEAPYKKEPVLGNQPITVFVDGRPEEVRSIYLDGELLWVADKKRDDGKTD